MLYVGFVAPHYPLVAPSQFLDMYPIKEHPAAKLHPKDGYKRHPWVETLDGVIGQDHFFNSDEERLQAIAAYLALCSFVDAEIGIVLDALRDNGFEASTRVIYTSDHGDNMGARGLWGKSVLYEESTRIPMIVSGPDIPRDKVSETPVTLLDIHQTAVGGLGQRVSEADADLSGTSLFEAATNGSDANRLVTSEYHAMGAPPPPLCCDKANGSTITMKAMRPSYSTSATIQRSWPIAPMTRHRSRYSTSSKPCCAIWSIPQRSTVRPKIAWPP